MVLVPDLIRLFIIIFVLGILYVLRNALAPLFCKGILYHLVYLDPKNLKKKRVLGRTLRICGSEDLGISGSIGGSGDFLSFRLLQVFLHKITETSFASCIRFDVKPIYIYQFNTLAQLHLKIVQKSIFDCF